ncbi:MAG TPA: SCO family protein [Vicinamibacteria bacterium]|nr:SCO family protein [Vicinamibacteria bacterium]
MRRAATAAALIFLTASAAAAQPAAPAAGPAAGEAPPILRDIGWDQRPGQGVPLDVEVRDEEGRPRRLADYFGRRPVVLSLVYYECPMLCTLTLNGLTAALERSSFVPGREFELVTLSFDARETPPLAAAKKNAHLKKYGRPEAAAGWHFLTAGAPAIQALTKAVGFRYAWDEASRQFAHPSGLVVLTPDGRIARYLYGVEYSPKDLRLAVVEAAEGRIGTAVDRVALFCYRYDALRGRYSLMVVNLVRAAALVTVVGMAALIVTLRRRERAR